MRNLQTCLIVILWTAAVFADGGTQCRSDQPDWGYAYQNPHYVPDNAPPAVRSFHDAFIPMYEARHSRESAYIRENACQLYDAARAVPGSLTSYASADQRQHFNRAAKDLVRSCQRLKEIVHGGANAEVYDQMHQIERDYLRVANLSE
jgi:hypothetical protein